MSQVKMFSQLDDDVRQAERNTGITPREKGSSKGGNKSSVDHKSQARQGNNVVFKELIYKLLDQIRDKPYFKKPNDGSVPITRRKDTKLRIVEL